ncbi:MAG: TraR/DksA C4-type zinc finger protein [Thermodesulfobacteriota bacterium]|nr:TraR/DksA C4-type zinc finger protein [Thermodesulfobacteriota bacterium]
MTREQREKLEEHIREKIGVLKKDIVSYKELTKPVSPDNAIGRLTRMEAISSKGIHEAALRKAEHTLSRLERALTMIDDPDFGLCLQCEEPIPFKRLLVLPESVLCVRCAEKRGI